LTCRFERSAMSFSVDPRGTPRDDDSTGSGKFAREPSCEAQRFVVRKAGAHDRDGLRNVRQNARDMQGSRRIGQRRQPRRPR
jgi:hypothetical protein